MPRIRTIKPEALQHRKVGRLSDRAFRLWIAMLTQADDHGRFIADTEQLRVVAFAYHPPIKGAQVEAALDEVASSGLVRLYVVDGVRYGDFPSWHEHQKVSHPMDSKLPAMADSSEDSGMLQNAPDHSGLARARGSDRIGSDQGSDRNGVGLRPTARRLLEFLNEKAGRSYRPVPPHLDLIVARLKDGATEANCRGVIVRKVREWRSDPKTAKWLRPSTLFRASNFENYLGEREPEETTDGQLS